MDPLTKIALDVGSSSLRIMMGQLDQAKNVLSVRELGRVAHKAEDRDGQFCWDIDKLTKFVRETLTDLKQNNLSISSVGVDTWGVDYVVVDHHGNPLKPAVCYRDERGARGRGLVKDQVSESDQYRTTGILPQDINTLYQLSADREALQKLSTDQDAQVMLLPDFFSNICASAWSEDPDHGLFVNGASRCIASTTGMLQHGQLRWAPALVEAAGIPPQILPAVCDELQVAADVNGLKIIRAGSHDTACAEFAVPGNGQRCLVSSGSWCVVSITLDKPLISEAAYKLGVTNEMSVDGRYRASINLTGLWLLQRLGPDIQAKFGPLDHGEIAAKAAASDTDSPIFDVQDEEVQKQIATLAGLKSYLHLDGDDDRQYWRALRSLVVSLGASHANSLKGLGAMCNFDGPIYMVGGGSRNTLYTETMKRILEADLTQMSAEGSTMGNLLAQYEVDGFEKSAIKVQFTKD